MKLERKYEQIKKSAIKDATDKANEIIQAHKDKLSSEKEEYIKDATENSNILIENAKKHATLHSHKLTIRQISKMRRELLDKYSSYKSDVINIVVNKLDTYMKTDEYYNLLVDWIKKDMLYANKDDEIVIYINPTDSKYKEKLIKDTSANIIISDIDFLGGIKSVITNRRILLDHSFNSKIEKIKQEYNYDQGKINGKIF